MKKITVCIRVDGLVGLEIERDLLFLAFIREDRTHKEHETIRRHTVIELETLLGRCNGSQDRETVDTRFDVGSGTLCTYVNVAYFDFSTGGFLTYSSANIFAARET